MVVKQVTQHKKGTVVDETWQVWCDENESLEQHAAAEVPQGCDRVQAKAHVEER